MFFSDDRKQLRDQFRQAWRKKLAGETLEPLEKQIATLIEEHPCYHSIMLQDDDVLDQDFTHEHANENPFLHLSLHLALREQVGTNRPSGIQEVTRLLLLKYQDGHDLEHRMMACLGEFLWDAQRQGLAPDEIAYLERLKELL